MGTGCSCKSQKAVSGKLYIKESAFIAADNTAISNEDIREIYKFDSQVIGLNNCFLA